MLKKGVGIDSTVGVASNVALFAGIGVAVSVGSGLDKPHPVKYIN